MNSDSRIIKHPDRYSHRTLCQRLGLEPGMRAYIYAPENHALWKQVPASVELCETLCPRLDYIHVFVTRYAHLKRDFPRLKKVLSPRGMIWISWPKRGPSVFDTNLNEHFVRDIGLQNALVDVKVVAVDEVWSGLKFVRRRT